MNTVFDEIDRLFGYDESTVIRNVIAEIDKDAIITEGLMRFIYDAICHLSSLEYGIIINRYGERKLTFEELGSRFGVSRSTSKMVQLRGINKIKRKLSESKKQILTKDVLENMEIKSTECFADRTAEYYYKLGYKQALKDIKEYVK